MSSCSIVLARDYDRTRALVDGRVLVGGRRADCEVLPSPPVTFRRMAEDPSVVAGEMSFGFYLALLDRPEPSPFVGLPVFLSRSFRHGNVYVRRDSDLTELADLRGRTVGLEEYAMTMAIWIRGLLDDEGVAPQDVRWRTARAPVVIDGVEDRLAVPVDVAKVERGIWELLADGQLDAAIGRPPAADAEDGGPFRLLLADHHARELAYLRATGVFPIMHLLVVRREHLEREPSLADDLVAAFDEAKDLALDELRSNVSTLAVSLPFLRDHVARTEELLGRDWWPYGIDANRASLEAFVAMATRQGIVSRPFAVEELFASELALRG